MLLWNMRLNQPEDGSIPTRDTHLKSFLAKAGLDGQVAEAALTLDAVLQRWRRRVSKQELGHSALKALELKNELDLAQLDVLVAIRAPLNEFGADQQQETMVSTIAERLRIDPSRASRLVSELIERGYARRAVSQQDARRTIVELTAKGESVVDAVRRFKFLVMGEFLSGWSEEEIATFIPLMERFSAWTDEAAQVGPDRFTEEVAEIVAHMRETASG